MQKNRQVLFILTAAILALSTALVIMHIMQGNTWMSMLWGIIAIANAATLTMHIKAKRRDG